MSSTTSNTPSAYQAPVSSADDMVYQSVSRAAVWFVGIGRFGADVVLVGRLGDLARSRPAVGD